MIAHFDLTQKTEDWYRMRWGKIGGTLSKGLLIDSDTLKIDILSMLLEDFELDEDSYESADMVRGIELEPQARIKLNEYTGLEFLECGWLQSKSNPLLGISPDGITADLLKSAEIKCFGRKLHTEVILSKQIPKEHLRQCLHYFVVNSKCQEHYFSSFRPESKYPLFVKKLTINDTVDLGTPSKPVKKTIGEWVALMRTNADKLNHELEVSQRELEF